MTIEIDGKEYEVLGTETKGDSFGIHTNAGTKGGTFWMKPCEPRPGQAAFYMGKNGFVKALPPECPQKISRITFDEPKLSKATVAEILSCCLANKKEFLSEYNRQKKLLARIKERRWCLGEFMRHYADEKRKQNEHGYIDSTLYAMNTDPDCLHKFKWAAEYMDEDGRGTFILFERLAGPDPLPKGFLKTPHERKVSGERAKAARNNKKVTPDQEKKIKDYYWSLRQPKDPAKKPATKNNAGELTDTWIRRSSTNGGLGLSDVNYSSRQIQRIAGDVKSRT